MKAHVRCERATRDAFPNECGADLPPTIGKSWCGEVCSNQWFFHGAEHVLTYLSIGGPIEPCTKCLADLRSLITEEIGSLIIEELGS